MIKRNLSLFILLLALFGSNTILAQGSNWVAPKYSDDLKNPFVNNSDATAEGKKMYAQMCAICHGMDGKGNGMAGVTLKPKPANFLTIDVMNESDGAIFWKITEGKAPMASYKEMLNENQRWKLVNYIRFLEKKRH